MGAQRRPKRHDVRADRTGYSSLMQQRYGKLRIPPMRGEYQRRLLSATLRDGIHPSSGLRAGVWAPTNVGTPLSTPWNSLSARPSASPCPLI